MNPGLTRILRNSEEISGLGGGEGGMYGFPQQTEEWRVVVWASETSYPTMGECSCKH